MIIKINERTDLSMYISSAYLNDSRLAFADNTRPLIVGSCGTYRILSKPSLTTYRPYGRIDYQLLYIASGQAHFFFEEKEYIVTEGHMVIYYPDDCQKYVYYKEDKTEVFWIHFTGKEVPDILRKYNLNAKNHIIRCGCTPLYANLFGKIISELQKCQADYETLSALLLEELFIAIHRNIKNDISIQSRYLENEMELAIHYFNENYNKEISIEEYANSRGMSISWFIRSFKSFTSSPPMQYITALRIANAKMLLENTDYSIKEIACIVGYDNPLYFSRIFSKHTGMSPSLYRQKQ